MGRDAQSRPSRGINVLYGLRYLEGLPDDADLRELKRYVEDELLRRRPYGRQRRLGADVDRYSFIVVDLHHLLLAGLPAHFEVLRVIRRGRHQNSGTCLEPISKSFEKDNEAGELDKAEEIVGVVFPANKDAALPFNPGEEALDEPAALVAA